MGSSPWVMPPRFEADDARRALHTAAETRSTRPGRPAGTGPWSPVHPPDLAATARQTPSWVTCGRPERLSSDLTRRGLEAAHSPLHEYRETDGAVAERVRSVRGAG